MVKVMPQHSYAYDNQMTEESVAKQLDLLLSNTRSSLVIKNCNILIIILTRRKQFGGTRICRLFSALLYPV